MSVFNSYLAAGFAGALGETFLRKYADPVLKDISNTLPEPLNLFAEHPGMVGATAGVTALMGYRILSIGYRTLSFVGDKLRDLCPRQARAAVAVPAPVAAVPAPVAAVPAPVAAVPAPVAAVPAPIVALPAIGALAASPKWYESRTVQLAFGLGASVAATAVSSICPFLPLVTTLGIGLESLQKFQDQREYQKGLTEVVEFYKNIKAVLAGYGKSAIHPFTPMIESIKENLGNSEFKVAAGVVGLAGALMYTTMNPYTAVSAGILRHINGTQKNSDPASEAAPIFLTPAVIPPRILDLNACFQAGVRVEAHLPILKAGVRDIDRGSNSTLADSLQVLANIPNLLEQLPKKIEDLIKYQYHMFGDKGGAAGVCIRSLETGKIPENSSKMKALQNIAAFYASGDRLEFVQLDLFADWLRHLTVGGVEDLDGLSAHNKSNIKDTLILVELFSLLQKRDRVSSNELLRLHTALNRKDSREFPENPNECSPNEIIKELCNSIFNSGTDSSQAIIDPNTPITKNTQVIVRDISDVRDDITASEFHLSNRYDCMSVVQWGRSLQDGITPINGGVRLARKEGVLFSTVNWYQLIAGMRPKKINDANPLNFRAAIQPAVVVYVRNN